MLDSNSNISLSDDELMLFYSISKNSKGRRECDSFFNNLGLCVRAREHLEQEILNDKNFYSKNILPSVKKVKTRVCFLRPYQREWRQLHGLRTFFKTYIQMSMCVCVSRFIFDT